MDSKWKWEHVYFSKRIWRVIFSVRREFGLYRVSIIWVR